MIQRFSFNNINTKVISKQCQIDIPNEILKTIWREWLDLFYWTFVEVEIRFQLMALWSSLKDAPVTEYLTYGKENNLLKHEWLINFFLEFLLLLKKNESWKVIFLCTRDFHPTISIATENLDLPSWWWYWWYILQWNGKNDNTGPSIAAAIALPKTHRGITSMKCWIPAFVIPNQKHTNLVGYFVSIAG